MIERVDGEKRESANPLPWCFGMTEEVSMFAEWFGKAANDGGPYVLHRIKKNKFDCDKMELVHE